MEKTTSEKIRLAVFVIVGFLFFIAAVYLIGRNKKLFDKTEHISAVFNNAGGLILGNNVRYSGINIGTVQKIEMINDTTINVDMLIDQDMFKFIKKDAIASISSDGLVGNMIINIQPGNGTEPLIEPGDILQSRKKVQTDEMLNTLSSTNKNIAQISADLLQITKKITEGKGTVGLLLSDTLMSNDLKVTMLNLRKTSTETAKSIESINKLIASLNNKDNVIGVLNDTVTSNKLKIIFKNLENSSNEVDKVVTNLNATILNIKDGKGAINYLSNDPNLVKKIDSTMTNINTASFKLNEDLEALKSNFLFKGYFKKQEKEKLKEESKK